MAKTKSVKKTTTTVTKTVVTTVKHARKPKVAKPKARSSKPPKGYQVVAFLAKKK